MSYSLATLWYERQRFLPGVLAVAFSCVLIALQCGLLLGLFSITSIPIDESRADLWIGHPEVNSVDIGRPIPESWQSYVDPKDIERFEPYMQGFAYWDKPTGGVELCLIIGTRLTPDAMGPVRQLTPEHRALISMPGNIVIDDSEWDRVGVTKIGDTAEISGRRVRIVGTVSGLRSLAGPYVFCSLETARMLLRPPEGQVTFLLAKCKDPSRADEVVAKLQPLKKKLSAYTASGFSLQSRVHWLTKTKAGVAMGFAALLGLLVGAVVTSQTLYAATAASLKEYAVLRALGIPRWRMALAVLGQSFWVGAAGLAIAVPTIYLLSSFVWQMGAKVLLPWQLMALALGITMVMALISGLFALRILRKIEPVSLLR
jgi:putative ABC transport system permease protein